ncbi:MAG TPA: aspartate/glutamate racemase family protein, partial [Bacillales bacterium]|nr:aspartate/glutamate racemase family protein [Bacillales bacterium]
DSILPRLAKNGGNVDEVKDKLVQYAELAEKEGADAILNACSSVGEVVEKMREKVSVPVVRIDEAMAEEAISKGQTIGVAATLSTTLEPTIRLIQGKAAELGKTIQISPMLAESAYKRLTEGDPEGHDQLLSEALAELADQVDIVVLAQASMARVLAKLPESGKEKFLTSPELGVQRVKSVMEGLS